MVGSNKNVHSDGFFINKHFLPVAESMRKWIQDRQHKKFVLLEIGVGFNTPGVIRFPFERLAVELPSATLIRINPEKPEGPPGTLSIPLGIEKFLSMWGS